ncbi:hypothetical protein M409DRAFT_60474 [Zasmidium cellare ATCC 36951]|uniref:Uncharacterized protein n=1 Tax=Zasmidium cellare ATCC 36951 TaxID=1080233 RepID=A0A6A6BYL5_ZASCE|nr:uncharacterized protein M409DRAFT_60474 [Zasmidium cellare ATCC 36951]KAF2159881.1 hypothetical protein M409DRAFT_60474 [Zasmidium cellare ATCC 36951]
MDSKSNRSLAHLFPAHDTTHPHLLEHRRDEIAVKESILAPHVKEWIDRLLASSPFFNRLPTTEHTDDQKKPPSTTTTTTTPTTTTTTITMDPTHDPALLPPPAAYHQPPTTSTGPFHTSLTNNPFYGPAPPPYTPLAMELPTYHQRHKTPLLQRASATPTTTSVPSPVPRSKRRKMLCVGVAVLCAVAIVIAFLVGWEEFKKGGGGNGGDGAVRGDDYHRGDWDGGYGGTPVGFFWKGKRDGGVEAAEEVPIMTMRDVEVEMEMEGNEVVAVAGDDCAFMREMPVTTEVPIVGRAACGDECEDEEEKKPKGLPPWGGPGDYLGR